MAGKTWNTLRIKSNREYLPLGRCLLLFFLAQSKATLLDQFQKGTRAAAKNPLHGGIEPAVTPAAWELLETNPTAEIQAQAEALSTDQYQHHSQGKQPWTICS